MYIYVSEMKKKTKKTSPINFFKTIITKFRSKNTFRREKNKQTVRIVYFNFFPDGKAGQFPDHLRSSIDDVFTSVVVYSTYRSSLQKVRFC